MGGPGEDRTLLEREGELAALSGSLERAAGGRGSAMVIAGPAGIGKTSLLAATAARARARGMAVLEARGAELERHVPHGLTLQLLTPLLRGLGESERDSLLSGPAAVTRPLLLRAPEGDGDPDGDPGSALLHGLHWLVSELAEREPLAVLVDDAHWGDEQSLRFLAYLARRTAELGVAIVAALRTGEPTPTGLDALRELAAAELRPASLSVTAAAELVEAELPGSSDAFRRACSDATGGNPFYLQALLRELAVQRVEPDDDAAARVRDLEPVAVTHSVLARYARLGDAAASLARALAVLGDGAALRDAARLAGLEPDAAAAAADALADAELVASGDVLRFAHPIVRGATYAEIPPATRARMHHRAAAILREAGVGAEQVAEQLAQSAPAGDGWAVDALREAAARAAARGDPSVATRHLERALREGAPDDRASLLLEAGLNATTAGDRRGVEWILESAAAFEDDSQAWFALMEAARVLGVRGHNGESARVFARAAERAGPDDPLLRSWAEAGYAMAGAHDLGMRAEARAKLARLADGEGIEALPVGRALLAFEAMERVYAGLPRGEAVPLALRAGAGAELDDPVDFISLRISGLALAVAGEFAEARARADAVLARAREIGSDAEMAGAAHVRAVIAFQLGDVNALAASAQLAVEGFNRGWGVALPTAHTMLCVAELERGDLEGASRALALPGGEERWERDLVYPMLLEARGEVELAQGRVEAAAATFERVAAMFAERDIANPGLAHLGWRSGLALCLARLGERASARALADEELELAERFGMPRAIAVALRTRGLVGPDGLDDLARAAELLERSGYELELARCLTELGAALRRARRRTEAREPLRRAIDLARAQGGLAVAERAHEELRATGARPRKLVFTGLESLTSSERRVAALAAQGRTNREIAAELYVTPKTVSTHLSHIYRKLEITSRTELPTDLAVNASDS